MDAQRLSSFYGWELFIVIAKRDVRFSLKDYAAGGTLFTGGNTCIKKFQQI